MVSAGAQATVNLGVIAKLYINKKEGQRAAFDYLEIKSNQLLRYGNSPFDLLIC